MEMPHLLILLTMLPFTLGCIRDPLDKDGLCLTTQPPTVIQSERPTPVDIPSETPPPTDHITTQPPYDQTKPGNGDHPHLTDPNLYLSMSVDPENDPRNLQHQPRLDFDPIPLSDVLGTINLPKSPSTFDVTGIV